MPVLNLKTVRSPHERVEQVYPPEALGADQESWSVLAPATLAFDIYKDADRFRLVGALQTVLELSCSRCLEPFRWPVDAAFDLRYQPLAPPPPEGEREVQEDDLSSAFYEDETIDLGQLMREQCYLAVPMKPLCREACRGLCPQCGTNMNREPCACSRAWDDPRLAPLKSLRTTKKES
jgi:uncharacterized protein